MRRKNKTDQKTKKNKKSVMGYIVGSTVLCAAASMVIPKAIWKVSGIINKYTAKIANKRRDDE